MTRGRASLRTARSVRAALATLLVAALAGLGAACDRSPPGPGKRDAALINTVQANLSADLRIAPYAIEVRSNDGIVQLSGTVERTEIRQLAERIALESAGVCEVENAIVVRGEDTGQSTTRRSFGL